MTSVATGYGAENQYSLYSVYVMTEILGQLNEMQMPGSGWNGSRKISPSVDDEGQRT